MKQKTKIANLFELSMKERKKKKSSHPISLFIKPKQKSQYIVRVRL